MQIIDLSKIQTGDVLLSTGGGKISGGIRATQTAMHLKLARFSHAAMFITPTILIESSDAGVVFERFTNRTSANNLGRSAEWLNKHPRAQRMSSRLSIECKEDRVRMFGGLPDADEIEIVRHNALNGINHMRPTSSAKNS
jgi:hypothetical protein